MTERHKNRYIPVLATLVWLIVGIGACDTGVTALSTAAPELVHSATPDIGASAAAAVKGALPTPAPTNRDSNFLYMVGDANIDATVEARLQATIEAISTPTPSPTASSKVDEYVLEGTRLSNLALNDLAVVQFTKAIQVSPNNAVLYWLRGLSYNNLGKYQQALHDQNQAIHLDNTFAPAYVGRGSAYNGLELFPQADADLDTACRLDSQFCLEQPKGPPG